MTTRRKFNKQFKIDAVNLLETTGKSVYEAAADLGINANTLWRWKRELTLHEEQAFPGNGNAQEDELRRLRKEVADLRLERDILKKAMAIFSQPDRKNTNS